MTGDMGRGTGLAEQDHMTGQKVVTGQEIWAGIRIGCIGPHEYHDWTEEVSQDRRRGQGKE